MMLLAFLLLRHKVITPAQTRRGKRCQLPCAAVTPAAGTGAHPPLPNSLAIFVRVFPLLHPYLRDDRLHPKHCGAHSALHCARSAARRPFYMVSARNIPTTSKYALGATALARLAVGFAPACTAAAPETYSRQTHGPIANQKPYSAASRRKA